MAAAETSGAAAGCQLQSLVDNGGLVAVPSGCQEDGPIMVADGVELAGGPVTVTGGFVVADGASLTLTDDTALVGPVTVQAGGTLRLTGSGAAIDGAVWVQGSAVARLDGVGPAGAAITDLINQGLTEVAGLVRLGQEGRGFTSVADGSGSLEIAPLAVGSRLWLERPAAPVIVARLVDGTFGPAGPEAVVCDAGLCVTDTVPGAKSDRWVRISPAEPPTEPTPSASPSASPSQGPAVTPAETLGEQIGRVGDGGVIRLEAGTVATEPVVVADADGGPISITLTGGPVRRGHAGTLFQVPAGSTLVLRDIDLDGSWSGSTDPDGAIVEIAAGGAAILDTGASVGPNQSFGIVNSGTLNIVGPDAAISNCHLDAAAVAASTAGESGPVGGAGVWNRAGGVFWMSGGVIESNTVVAGPDQVAFGGGVLNAGSMRLAGGSVSGNQVDGGGGGVAVVREPGSDFGGRLDIGGDHKAVAGAELPTISANSAEFGGGLAVVDQGEWGGAEPALPAAVVPGDVPAVIVDQGSLTGNKAAETGGAVMAYGGSAVGLEGPATVTASNAAGVSGTDGIAVEDAYLRVSGDIQTESGGGVALLKQGWPLILTSGFTGNGQLVIEKVDGLKAGQSLAAIQLEDPTATLSPQAEAAIVFAIEGLEVSMAQEEGGQLLLHGRLAGTDAGFEASASPTPTKAVPTPTKAVPTPSQAAPTPTRAVPTPTKSVPTPSAKAPGTPSAQPPSSAAPSPTPTQSWAIPEDEPTAPPAPTASAGRMDPTASSSTGGGSSQADPVGVTGSLSPSASAAPTASASAGSSTGPGLTAGGGSPSAGLGVEEGENDATNLSAPEPPAGMSSKTIGLGLMAIGIFGLAGLGVYVMRRGGFFAA
ncbi:MAG: hypothetical protein LBD70_01535 [Bifidobacteriaceae bacterium]|nr:hypothetical protein [Bifidobacteriaceae bacterium]